MLKEFKSGQWIMVDLEQRNGKLHKGYIVDPGVYQCWVMVWIPEANTWNRHRYPNEFIHALPMDTFENEKELYIDAALLLRDKNTFMEVMNNETTI